MLQGDYGATLEILWSYPARKKGRSEQMVEEADGESEKLPCERGREMGKEGGRNTWGTGNRIVFSVSFQSEWMITAVQDL